MPKKLRKVRNLKQIESCGGRKGKKSCWFETEIIDITKPIAA